MPGIGISISPFLRKKGSGWSSAIVALIIDYTATQFTFKFKLPSTKTIKIHWGDGTSEDVVGQDATLITKTSSYSGAGTYKFWISGDDTDITYIDVNGQAFVSGSYTEWYTFSNLTYLDVSSTGMSGNIEGYAALTSMTTLNADNTTATGDASLLAPLTSLTSLLLNSTSVTWDNDTAMGLTSATVNVASAGLSTSAMVNNFIASLSTSTDGTFNIAGTNAHRTAASNDNLNTLLANGNTITINDVLGDELYTGLNVANDNVTEDITAFVDYAATIDGGTKVTQGQDISNMLPLGDELLAHPALDADDWSKDAGWTYDGGDDEYDCDGTNDADLYITEANDDGKYYLLEITTTGYSSGSLKARYGESEWFILSFTGNETLSAVIRKEVTSDVLEIRSVNYTGSVSNISLKEIEVLGNDLVTNGGFDADTNWTKPANVTIVGGVASCNNAAGTLYQSSAKDAGWYLYKITISNYTDGSIKFRSNDGNYYPSTPFTSNGTYTPFVYNDGSYDYNTIQLTAFTGDIDNVSVHKLTVTKEIAGSTNYTGDHFVIPEEGEDLDSFIIPVDYVAEGIVAQKITGESNLTTGWTAANNAVLTTEETNVSEGFAALEIESNTTPTANADADTDITVENGEVYRLSVDHRHIGVGDDWILEVEGATADTLDNTETTYATKVYYFTAGDTTCTIRYKENNASNDGGIYADNISLKKVTFS